MEQVDAGLERAEAMAADFAASQRDQMKLIVKKIADKQADVDALLARALEKAA
jgi:hypothetical protein